MDQVLLHQRHEGKQVARECVRAAHAGQRPEQFGVDARQNVAHDDPFLESVQEQALAIRRMVA